MDTASSPLPDSLTGAASTLDAKGKAERKEVYDEICKQLNRLPTSDQRMALLLMVYAAQAANYQTNHNLNKAQRHKFYKNAGEHLARFFKVHLLDLSGPLAEPTLGDAAPQE